MGIFSGKKAATLVMKCPKCGEKWTIRIDKAYPKDYSCPKCGTRGTPEAPNYGK